MRPIWTVLPLGMMCLIALAGCGGSDHSPLGEVTGTVKYKGQPIESGTIIFEVPDARSANGKIVDGRITEVMTYDPGDGVPIGLARIAVFATASSPAPTPERATSDPGGFTPTEEDYMGAGDQSLIPKKYNDPATSGLTWEIKAGDNTIPLDLGD